MDIQFESLQELYERLKPVLRTKQQEMVRSGYDYIKMEDIWNYLKEIKWKSSHNLSLYEMVNDVLNCYSEEIDNYFKNKMKREDRIANFDSEW